MSWTVETSTEFDGWYVGLTDSKQDEIDALVEVLVEQGPNLKRPLVGEVKGSKIANLKELRRGTIRILFCFDPERQAVLLVGGDKKGEWKRWYKRAIKTAEAAYDRHLAGAK